MTSVVDLTTNKTVTLVSIHGDSAMLNDGGRIYYQTLNNIRFPEPYPAPGGFVGPRISSLLTGVEPLGQPDTARQLSAGATSTNMVLTSTCQRASLFARGADIRFRIGSGATQTATTNSHWIANGERLDVRLPVSANIAAIRAASVDGVLEISELI
jgi:hypothetical protein